jgi:HEAT repeat protein
VRLAAGEALGNTNDPRAVEPLLAALKDEDAKMRGVAAAALNELLWGLRGPQRAEAPLRDVEALRAVQPLIAALKGDDSAVRFAVAVGLGAIGDPRAVQPLIAALKDEDSHVRGGAALGLAAMIDPRAVKPLKDARDTEKNPEAKRQMDIALTMDFKKAGRTSS